MQYTGTGASTNRTVTMLSSATIDASGTGAISFTKTLLLSTGKLIGATANTTVTLTGTNTGANTMDERIGNPTVGTTSLVKNGTGTWVLAAPAGLTTSNAYTGITTINQGILEVDTNSALGTTAGGTSVTTSGAELRLGNVNYALAEPLTINGTGVSNAGALSNSGTSIFAGAITVASNATIGSGGGTLTLTGGIVKNGTTLTLAGGGVININSVISGSLPNSDLIVNGTTANLNATNTYNGPTSVVSGGNVVLGVNNAIPSNSAVTLGDASTTGTLTMGTLTNAIGSLTFGTSPGGGTVKMAANQTASAQLSASTANGGTGLVALGSASTIDLTGMQSLAGLYRLISGNTGLSGTFGTVTGLNSAYTLLYTPTEVDAQHRADQTFSVTTPTGTARALVSSSVSLNGTLTNAAPNGSADMAVALTSTGTLSVTSLNSSTGATVSVGSPSTITGNIQAGATAGTFGWQVTNTDANAIPTSQSISGSINVVNERTYTSPATVNLGRALLGGTLNSGPQTIQTTGLHATTADATLGTSTSGAINGLSLTGGPTLADGSASPFDIFRTISGTLTGTAGTLTGTFHMNSVDEFGNTITNAASVSYTVSGVNERTYTSPSTLDFGNLLFGASVSSTQTITTAGLHADTADATLGTSTSGVVYGVVLTGGPDFVDGSTTPVNINRTITGAFNTGLIGTKSGTFNMNSVDEFGNTVTNAASVSYTVNAGNATTAHSDRGGIQTADRLAYQLPPFPSTTQTLFNAPILTAVVGNGNSYAGLASKTVFSQDGSEVLGTVATILQGTNTSGNTNTVSMTWRDRSNLERPNGSTPPLPTTFGSSQRYLLSDVVLLTGMDSGEGQTVDTKNINGNDYTITNHQTDDFVLQMSYSGGAIPTLDWLNPATSTWELANTGDFPALPVATGTELDYVGSFSSFQSAHGSDLSTYLGAYGYDPTTSVAWAVINHKYCARRGRRSARTDEFRIAWIGSVESTGPA